MPCISVLWTLRATSRGQFPFKVLKDSSNPLLDGDVAYIPLPQDVPRSSTTVD